jgi:aspartate kinase
VPILCSETHGKARIEEINPDNMLKSMSNETGNKKVAVLAGFQGVTQNGRISTLGRGGSDTTAVALAAALKADRCDIYTDVDGVYTTDPRITKKAKKINKISYEEMLEMASLGAKVLQTRSVEMAYKYDMPLQVLSSFEDNIGSEMPGTLVTREEDIMEKQVVNGVTYAKNEAKITLFDVPDTPGIAAEVFGPLTQCDVNVDMIVQNVSQDGKVTDLTFTVPEEDLERAQKCLNENEKLKGANIVTKSDIVKISVVGIGMVSHAGVAQTMFKTLADKGINIHIISTSEIKISVIIDKEYLELAVRSLHNAYGLDAE